MNIDFSSVFSIYVFVSLAVIFTAWLLTTWKANKRFRHSGRHYSCNCCGKTIRAEHALISVRCGYCGAKNEIKKMKIIES